jgi:phosphatidylglycerol:prolipoprotein diacylglycerol transferase
MYPDVFRLGLLHVRSYGLMLAIAFLVGTWIALKEARRLKLDEDKLVTVILATLVSGVLGARALYVIEHIDEFRGGWGSILAIWQGGLTLYGGIAAGALVGLLMAKRMGMPVWSVADALTPSVALGTMFGRIGCFLNGCCYGKPTNLPWGVIYPPDSFPGLEFGHVPIHPAQLYFSLAGLILFLLLWAIRKRVTIPGQLFWIFVATFGVVRLFLDFTRAYEPSSRIANLGPLVLTESQLWSIAMALFATLMMIRLKRPPAGVASMAQN